MRATTMTLAILAAVATASPLSVAAQKAKYYTADVTFTDTPTSSSVPGEVRLTGDGQPFSGLATIVTAPAGTLALDLTRTNRRLRVTLKDGAALTPGVPLPTGTGLGEAGRTFVAGSELSVYGVRSIAVGSAAVREMGVVVDEIKRGYRLRFQPNAAIVGTMVCVTRHTLTTWTISSLFAGDVCGTSGDTSGGETTRLVDQGKSTTVHIAAYVMPFSFDVNCPTCK